MLFRVFSFVLLVFSALSGVAFAGEKTLRIYAASSMQDALKQIAGTYEDTCKCRVKLSFASSSTLARQIDAGAPADVYISANQDWVQWLANRNKIKTKPIVIARNELVIASSALTKDSFNILYRGRFAMGDPLGVPAGIYAKQALSSMGIWDKVKAKAVYTENVRVALAMIERGDLKAGIVYASDLRAAPKLHAHYRFNADDHSPIEYLAVQVMPSPASHEFVAFLSGGTGQAMLQSAGFLKAGK